jgi:hypothetical protein
VSWNVYQTDREWSPFWLISRWSLSSPRYLAIKSSQTHFKFFEIGRIKDIPEYNFVLEQRVIFGARELFENTAVCRTEITLIMNHTVLVSFIHNDVLIVRVTFQSHFRFWWSWHSCTFKSRSIWVFIRWWSANLERAQEMASPKLRASLILEGWDKILWVAELAASDDWSMLRNVVVDVTVHDPNQTNARPWGENDISIPLHNLQCDRFNCIIENKNACFEDILI